MSIKAVSASWDFLRKALADIDVVVVVGFVVKIVKCMREFLGVIERIRL